MTFVERFEHIMAKRPPTPLAHVRTWAIGFSLAVYGIALWYLSLTEEASPLLLMARAAADTATVLVAFSFALSGLCYFWDFLDTKIIYRKYLGLNGLAYALVYMALAFFSGKASGTWMSGFWMTAVVIYVLMAVISNKYIVHEIGGIWWRRGLRVGYLGLLLCMIHLALLDRAQWKSAFVGIASLPPLSLIVFLVGLATILLRLALAVALFRKKHASLPLSQEEAPLPPTLPTAQV